MDPLKAVVGQRQGEQERGADGHGVDGRADIVVEARQAQLRCACSAANGFGPFEDDHTAPGLCQGDGGSQPVGPAAHDRCIGLL